MSAGNFLETTQKFEIQAYEKPKNWKDLRHDCVPFSGSPQKHPYDSEKFILISDPYSTHTFYYEFKAKDIAFVEELPNIVNIDGENLTMVRVWIKKRSIGVRCTPFLVEELNLRK